MIKQKKRGGTERFSPYERKRPLSFHRCPTKHLQNKPFSFNLTLQRNRRDGRAVEGARLESVYTLIAYRGFESLSLRQFHRVMVASIGPFAAICGEPRQVRKEATVATDSGAEMWLILAASISFLYVHSRIESLCTKDTTT
jgi:hypothetical protein